LGCECFYVGIICFSGQHVINVRRSS